MFCTHCGNKISDDAAFCPKCGAPVSGGRPQVRSQGAEDYEATQMVMPGSVSNQSVSLVDAHSGQKKKRTVLPIVLSVVSPIAIIALICLAYFDILPNPLTLLSGGSRSDEARYVSDAEDSNEEDIDDEDNEDRFLDEDEVAVSKESPQNESGDEEEADDRKILDENSWQAGFYNAIDNLNETKWTAFSVLDIDGNDIPEIFCMTEAGYIVKVLSWYGDEVVQSDIEGEIVAVVPGGNLIGTERVDDSIGYDCVFTLSRGEIVKVFEGNEYQDDYEPIDIDGAPYMIYTADGIEVDSKQYHDMLYDNYYSLQPLDLWSYGTVSKDEIMKVLETEDVIGTFDTAKNNEDMPVIDWEFNFEGYVRFFEAPYGGTYRFTLCGANGGGDGFRDYDAEGAVLTGTMELKAGERVAILTGGAGGITQGKAGVVDGGFNGGGSAYWSGGGGGCTDIYYNSVRIAAAAGSGGGQFDQLGKQGRTSDKKKNITDSKYGGSNPYRDKAGGGGGWYGGVSAPNEDEGGYGGVNGWNSRYFSMESESAGNAYTLSGSRDGSVTISFVG